MIVDVINRYLLSSRKTISEAMLESVSELAKFNFSRQFGEREDFKAGVRLSSCGKCARAQAYKLHDFPVNGKEMDARSSVTFFMGDVTENMMVHLAQLAGCVLEDVGLDQKTVSIDVNGTVVKGHPDGILIHPKYGRLLLEAKSMSSFAFRRFEKGEVDHSYLCQIMSYMKAQNLDKCVMLALNKDAGVLAELIINYDESVYINAYGRLADALASTPERLPEPEYGADAKGLYPWQCMYCANWKDCHPKAQRVLVGRSYKLKQG